MSTGLDFYGLTGSLSQSLENNQNLKSRSSLLLIQVAIEGRIFTRRGTLMKLKASFITLTFLCFFAFISHTNIVVAQSPQNVVWTSVVNCTVSGNSLQKTAGCNNCADAGAVSQKAITSGDGYVEFTASEQTTGRMIGLSNGNPGTTATEISYGILLSTSTRASAQEHAVYKDETGYVAGDVFRIAVVGGVVKYSKNGVVFYTSTVAPTYPLLVDTSLHTLNATLNNVVVKTN